MKMKLVILVNREEVGKLLDMIDVTKFATIKIKFEPSVSPEELTEVK